MRLCLLALVAVLLASCFNHGWCADDKQRIVCVGDSITFGSGVEERDRRNYPKVLENLLNAAGGAKVEVKNCGRSGATLLKHGDLPYWTQGEFKAAKEFNPQAVVIMLGTNDSKPQNWAHKDEFAADLTALVEEFAKLPSKPAVWLVLPPPAYKLNFGIRGEVIKDEVIPLVQQVAKEQKLPTIDGFGALSNHSELFPDGIHPNAAGAELLAKAVAAALSKPK